MQWREFVRKLPQLCKGKHTVSLLMILGFAGMGLMLLSSLLSSTHPADPVPTTIPDASAADSANSYATMLEEKLQALLQQMEGVGTVSVMVTVNGTAEQVYAEEVKASQNAQSSQSERALVLTKNNGTESALVAEVRYPAVQGVAILCSGGASASVRERVFQAVSTVLDISTADIFVGTTNRVPLP